MGSRRSRRGPLLFAGAVAVVLSCGEIREDEMLCEEAVSRLDECCPNIDPRRLNCVYNDGCGTALVPVFTPAASDCVRERACADMQARGICDGLRQLSYQPYPFQERSAFEKEACR